MSVLIGVGAASTAAEPGGTNDPGSAADDPGGSAEDPVGAVDDMLAPSSVQGTQSRGRVATCGQVTWRALHQELRQRWALGRGRARQRHHLAHSGWTCAAGAMRAAARVWPPNLALIP